MKPFIPLLLLLLSALLTACLSVQTQEPINLTGDWSGTLTHNDGQNVAIPLTITFAQTESDLGGTASLGSVPYQSSGEITGKLEDESVTFAFSFVAGETSNGEEVIQTIGTYTFTSDLNETALTGDFVATTEDSDIRVPGTFELARQ